MDQDQIVIRKAQLADTAEIAHVHVVAWQSAYKGLLPADLLASLSEERRRNWWQQMLEADLAENGIFIAQMNDEIVGFVLAQPARDLEPGKKWGEVNAIYLVEEAWGRGIGGRLWQAALEFLKSGNYETIMLWVLDGNERAIRFYEKIGFVQDRSPQGVKLEQLRDVTVRERRYSFNRFKRYMSHPEFSKREESGGG